MVAVAPDAITNLFDEAMAKIGGKEWSFIENTFPQLGWLKEDDIEDPITFEDFLRDATRKPGKTKSASILFDYHKCIPEFGMINHLAEHLAQGKDGSALPAVLRPRAPLPKDCRLGAIVRNAEDGTYEALMVYWFDDPLPTKDVVKLAGGVPLLPQYRNGPWAVKKSLVYIYGLKVPRDAATHLIGLREDATTNHYNMLCCATAFAELHTGRNTDFKDGTLEIDGTKTNISRSNKKENVHCGRFLVVFHRESRQYALEPLADASVKKGAPPPPETYTAVAPVVRAKFRIGHIAASDSAQAFKKAFKEMKDVPHVTVVHKKKNFAMVVKMPKKYLHKRLWKRVAKLPTTSSRTFRMKAGGNGAEATFSVLKRNLTRMNLSRSTTRASVNFLSAAWLSKHPGLTGVASAMKIYQDAIRDTCPPKDAYKSTKWLRTFESLESSD